MGGLRRYMPITFATMWIGTLALVGTPFFSGFYSKDTIIEAAGHHAHEAGSWVANYGYWAVLAGVFVTSFYSFRLLYLTFHGRERFRDADADPGHVDHSNPTPVTHDEQSHTAHALADHDAHDAHAHHGVHEPHESPWVVTIPLILLAIPSVLIGFFTIGPMLYGTGWDGHHEAASVPGQALTFFSGAISFLDPARDTVGQLAKEFHGPLQFALHGLQTPPFWLALAGFALATFLYLFASPELPARLRRTFALPVRILENKYGMDKMWIGGFAGGGVALGQLSNAFDRYVIDGAAVNGSARLIDLAAHLLRRTQSGLLYHYAFAMILGLIALLAVILVFWQ